jgi:hypothetical protein
VSNSFEAESFGSRQKVLTLQSRGGEMLSHKRDIAEHTHAVALYSSVPGLPCGPASDLNVYVYEGRAHGFHDSADAVKPLIDTST